MTQEKAIKLLPLTYDETEALKIALRTILAVKIDENCLKEDIGKTIWGQIILPQLAKINEKLKQ